MAVDESGDDQRGVRGESSRDHRRPGQPPAHTAAGEEVVVHALAGTAAKVQPEDKRDEEVAGDRRPVEDREVHGRGKDNAERGLGVSD